MCTERAIALVHMLTMKQLAEVLPFKYTKDIISIIHVNTWNKDRMIVLIKKKTFMQ